VRDGVCERGELGGVVLLGYAFLIDDQRQGDDDDDDEDDDDVKSKQQEALWVLRVLSPTLGNGWGGGVVGQAWKMDDDGVATKSVAGERERERERRARFRFLSCLSLPSPPSLFFCLLPLFFRSGLELILVLGFSERNGARWVWLWRCDGMQGLGCECGAGCV